MQVSSTFIILKLRYGKKKTVIWACQIVRHIIGKVKRWGILSKLSSNYVLNICLITFAWKFHQIYEHWCNNCEALIVIHLYCNNIPARKKKKNSHFCKNKKNFHWRLLCFNVCKPLWAFNKHVKNIWFGLGRDLTKITHLWPLWAPKWATSLKKFLYG